MGTISDGFETAFRDYVSDGIPASGANDVDKSEARPLGALIEGAINTVGLTGLATVKYATRAELDADLAHDADTVALVYADATDANNDLYVKTGASGAGSWTLTTIMHDIIGGLSQGYIDDASSVIATAVGRASLYGVSDLAFARSFAALSREYDFAGGYFRAGFAPYAAMTDLPGWTFTRASEAWDVPEGGALTNYGNNVARRTNKGLLIEKQAYQAAQYSSTFGSWATVTNVTVTTEGGNDFAGEPFKKIAATAAAATTLRSASAGTASANGNTAWFIIKGGTGGTVGGRFGLTHTNNSNALILLITFNYDTGQIDYSTRLTGTWAKATRLPGNAWLLELHADSGADGIAEGDGLRAYAGFSGAAQAAGDHFYMSHAQIESSAFPTSHIIANAGASFDRKAEAARVDFSSSGDFTVFAEADLGAHLREEALFAIDAGSSTNAIQVVRNATGGIDLKVTLAGSTGTRTVATAKSARRIKVALVSRAGEARLSVDGGVPIALTLARPASLSRLWLGQNSAGSQLNGYLRRMLVLDRAASDDEARAMTANEDLLPLASAPLVAHPTQGRYNPTSGSTASGAYGRLPVVAYGELPAALLIAENRGQGAVAIGTDGKLLWRDTTALTRWIEVDPLTGLCLIGSADQRSIRWIDVHGRERYSWTLDASITGTIYGVHTTGTQMFVNIINGAAGDTRIFTLDANGVPTSTTGTQFAAFSGTNKISRGMKFASGGTSGKLWIAAMEDPPGTGPGNTRGSLKRFDLDTGAEEKSYFGHYPNDVDIAPGGEVIWADEHLDRIRGANATTDVVRSVMAGLEVTANYEIGTGSISSNRLARVVAGSDLEAAAVEFNGLHTLYAPNGVAVISQGRYAIADTDNSRVIIAEEGPDWRPVVTGVVALINEPTKVRVIPAAAFA